MAEERRYDPCRCSICDPTGPIRAIPLAHVTTNPYPARTEISASRKARRSIEESQSTRAPVPAEEDPAIGGGLKPLPADAKSVARVDPLEAVEKLRGDLALKAIEYFHQFHGQGPAGDRYWKGATDVATQIERDLSRILGRPSRT